MWELSSKITSKSMLGELDECGIGGDKYYKKEKLISSPTLR